MPVTDDILDVTLAQSKIVLGPDTYCYDKSLVVDHDDVEEMIESGKGRCTVTLGHLSGTRETRAAPIHYEAVVCICISVPLNTSEYEWQKKYLEDLEKLIDAFLGRAWKSGASGLAVKYSCGTEKMPGVSAQHDIDEEASDETGCFRGMVSFLVHVEK